MGDAPRFPLAVLRDDFQALGAELRELAGARWELARLELREQGAQATRLVVAGVTAAVLALTALPLLVWCVADWLDGWLNVSRGVWVLGFAVALLALALANIGLAVRRFRRNMTGLQETLEELREDMVWLREWAGQDVPPEPGEKTPPADVPSGD